MKLLTDSGNATGAANEIRQWGNRELGHLFTLFVWGTFNSATVTMQISPDSTNWFDVSGVSLTAAAAINVEFRARYVRAVVAGGAAPVINALLV